ncbi:MAG: ribonuclease Z [Desulfobacter sp.]|nr:MAG: ribonuclease Z [Desulfobacter sp.]
MDGRMEIRILGSGTCVPDLNRFPCSVLLGFRGFNILADVGPGIMGQVLRAGLDPDEIDAICLSHFHLDHCADLAPLLFATKYPEFTRKKKLTLIGGPGLGEWFAGVNNAFGHTLDMPGDIFDMIELSGSGGIDLPGIRLRHMPMAHKPESMGFRFTDATGFSMVYSGDTDETKTLPVLAEKADILICESAMPDRMKVPGHLTPGLAARAARKAGAAVLVLTHLYPACDNEDIAGQARMNFAGKVVVARDMMRL